MFSNHFTTNFSHNAPVKKFENRSIFGKDMDKTLWLNFLGHPVYVRVVQDETCIDCRGMKEHKDKKSGYGWKPGKGK